MASTSQPRAFVREDGEEEITPPYSKTHTFDERLSFKLNSTPTDAPARDCRPPGPDSPTTNAAAAILTNVQSHSGMNKAVNCLMSLAAFGDQQKASALEPSSKKRARQASLTATAQAAGEPSDGTSTRRRLAMRPPGKSPRPQSRSPQHHALLASSGSIAMRPPGKSPRPRSRSPQHHALLASSGSTAEMLPSADTSEAPPPTAAAASPPCLRVTGIEQPVRLLSGAGLQQLKLLSAAFKLCPTPTAEQLVAIAHRASLSIEKLELWFQSRRILEAWVEQQPHLQPADIAALFFEGEDMQACGQRATSSATISEESPAEQC